MLSEKRGNLEILFDVLKAIERESRPTWILYKTKLAWPSLLSRLNWLEKNGLIKKCLVPFGKRSKRLTRRYFLTEEGRRLLQSANQLLMDIHRVMHKTAHP